MKPIYYKDDSIKQKQGSALIEELRSDIATVRGKLYDIKGAHSFGEHIEPIEGSLTCALIAMSQVADIMREFTKEKLGGEFFNVRGIGSDSTPGCFVCGGETGMNSNISGFVKSKESGETIINMFKSGARLDFREREPNWIQVKIGACKEHHSLLEDLMKEIQYAGDIITKDIVVSVTSKS